MDLNSGIGKQIKLLRNRTGLSQAKLADRSRVSVEYLSRVERGKAAASVNLLARLAEGMGVNLQDIFAFETVETVDPVVARANRIARTIVQADEEVGEVLEDLVGQVCRRLRSK